MYKYLKENGWTIRHTTTIPEQKGEYFNFDDLALTEESTRYINKIATKGLYKHQKEALKDVLESNNICLTTKTNSGKSLVFYVSAIEKLKRDKNAKILAIYPLRALSQEQEKHWNEAISETDLDVKVARIDGQVSTDVRMNLIKHAQILIMTPDIIHAWLLNKTDNKSIVKFISQIKLIIVDEIHNYTGVFGSNSAFLFRRLEHLMKLLGTSAQYITASATIKAPDEHLNNLFGLNFKIIDSDYDTSPIHKRKITFIEPPETQDVFSYIPDLLKYIAQNTDHKFLTFVDSRKQTEYITSIVTRKRRKELEESAEIEKNILTNEHLKTLNILPFRSGYELEDREYIQERLNTGDLKGVVSTSALELGINIPHLTLGILLGVPHSMTSFYQRIGRIGRTQEGEILIINTGDLHSEIVFNNPESIFQLPLSEGAMYLENPRIQYIHALCLARNGGEHDNICSYMHIHTNSEFKSPINWPKNFISLCNSERIGVVPSELQNMKGIAGNNPNLTFPLRDVDVQFRVKSRRGPYEMYLGSLSYNQLMREAYPGAIYYYATRAFRVINVNTLSRTVNVSREKKYTTKPTALPILVFPDLNLENIKTKQKYGDLVCLDCNLQIGERIAGYKEQRGSKKRNVNYPLDPKKVGLSFHNTSFARYYFTSGVILFHPALNNANVKCNTIANLLYEAFLMTVPFESGDIHFACDKFKMENNYIHKGDRFITIFDQTYGSLRLSSRFANTEVLRKALQIALTLAKNKSISIDRNTYSAMKKIYEASLAEPSKLNLTMPERDIEEKESEFIKIIAIGSKGLATKHNAVLKVEGVFFNPEYNGLTYRGKFDNDSDESLIRIIPIADVIEIPGTTKFSRYNMKTGVIDG